MYYDVTSVNLLRHCSKLKAYIHHWNIGSTVKGTDKARWEEDFELIENEGLFQEYLEMGMCPL